MDLITTHINADFDALGSLVAAKKLYPNSKLLLPGSQETAVREFLALAKELVAVESERECSLDGIDRLILVDTRHKSRIGIAAELLDKKIEIHIYDHHPRMKGDVVADKDVYQDVGASVTILADIIKRRKIKLTSLEATVMLLGIYEETGSLTYRSTTKLDAEMVSFLLSQGASLSAVSSYLNRELTQESLKTLTKLISLTKRVTINGISVSFIEITTDEYVSDLGELIHKLMDIENINVLFVILSSPKGRVDVVARSKITEVDVNKILSHFGGGGHPAAAAAKIKNAQADQIKARLIKILQGSVKVYMYASDIMRKKFKTVGAGVSIEKAKTILTKNHLGGMPVISKGIIAGIITSDGVNKALKRGFGHSKVKGYMLPEITTIEPQTPIFKVREMVMASDTGVLPVVKGRKVVGIVSRTDVLKGVYSALFAKTPPAIERVETLNLSKKMDALLPDKIVRLLKKIGKKAGEAGYNSFIVGGLVRDLILGVKNLDLDIVIEGDAIAFGHKMARELDASIIVHKRFGTCTLVTKAKLKIDLATARKETYERPAALPTVEFSSLKDDLVRRDFTINAMASSLNKGSFGQLVDFFGGERDLSRGVIKVLHDGSFIDDPTRIFRAVRFEQRFGFSIDSHTEDLIKHAIGKEMFKHVEPQRIRDELILILKEDKPYRAIKRMAELDELRFLHPKAKFDKRSIRLYGAVDGVSGWYEASDFLKRPVERWLIYLMALLEPLSYNDLSSICGKFVFRRSETLRLLSAKEMSAKVIKALKPARFISPSRIYALLEPLSFEVVLFLLAKAESARVKERVEYFFRYLNGAKVSIKGEDIKAFGLKPCAKFKEILRKVLYAKLDGKVSTREDELKYARKLINQVC